MEAELDIAAALSQRQHELITIHQLAKVLAKSYSFVYGNVQRMIAAGMIRQQRVGHAILCRLVFAHPRVQGLLALSAAETIDQELQRTIGPAITVWKSSGKLFLAAADARSIKYKVPQATIVNITGPGWVKDIDFSSLEIRANAAYFWALVGEHDVA
ncbi:MAG TPA: hypothetical protein VJK52_04995 [Candidatus Nanoarchaeia archaeon]|nr:hypothetical protein [Candidatus Nanoarchaeia archaeon]